MQIDSDAEIERNVHRFNLDLRVGNWDRLRLGTEEMEQLTFDLLVFLSRCGGIFDIERFEEELPPSSFIVLFHVINEAVYYKFIVIEYDAVAITMRGMKWLHDTANRYMDAARRDQEAKAYAIAPPAKG